jgi:hypothetical protein
LLGHCLDALTAIGRDAAKRLDGDLIRIGRRPIQGRRVLLDNFFADLVEAHFRLAQFERRPRLRVHSDRRSLSGFASRTSCYQFIRRRLCWSHRIIAARRDISNIRDGSVCSIGRLPVQCGRLTASGLRLRHRQLRCHWRDRDYRAGDTRFEPLLRPEIEPWLEVLGFDGAMVIQIHNHSLAGVHRYRSRPERLPLLSNRHLVAAGLHEQPLVPNPIVIELIDLADEIRRCAAIEQNGRPRVSL